MEQGGKEDRIKKILKKKRKKNKIFQKQTKTATTYNGIS